MVLPAYNTEAMNLHLVKIAKTVTPGAHAVLLVDQAGWHLSTRLVVPAVSAALAFDGMIHRAKVPPRQCGLIAARG